VRKWVANQLAAEGAGPVVVIDPARVVRDGEIEAALGSAEVRTVRDWFELRRDWERAARHRVGDGPRFALLVHDPAVRSETDLPFDIAQRSMIRRVRVPGPPEVHLAVTVLDDDLGEVAAERLAAGGLKPVDAVLTAAAGLPSLSVTGTPAREFQVALRLVDYTQPDLVLQLARAAFSDPLAMALLAEPSRLDEVQEAWDDWIANPSESGWSKHMLDCRAELTDQFVSGRLRPADRGAADLPAWTTVGVAPESPSARVAALLSTAPEEPTSLDGWVHAARWWGEVRSGLALVNPVDDDIEATAWEWWSETDERFLAWLRAHYGSQLTRTWANWPASLDKVQPFLAKRWEAGSRLLLVVLDGMSFTQWTRIRDRSKLRVNAAGGVLAMLPTLTEVSRQAIAAGTLPTQFSDSLGSTSKESQRWATAWANTGASTAWIRIDGARIDELDVVPLGTADVIGLVISATDEMMHSAEFLGDIGLHAEIDAWMSSGVLATLVERAASNNYETWLTADHGNLAVEPTKAPREGAFVERAGTRVRRYASRALRDDAAVSGIAWDTLPGYPTEESERLLFAPGRAGWGSSRLSHGGLSLDEVIVPLVQVGPAS
jgi:hypothetical protein